MSSLTGGQRQGHQDLLASKQVLAPITVMPNGKIATVYSHFQGWSVLSERRESSLLGAGSDNVKDALTTSNVRLLFLTKDANSVNHCIVAAEELEMREQRLQAAMLGRDLFTAIFPVECVSHQTCLAARPAVDSEVGLAGFMTRVGHLLEQGLEACGAPTDRLCPIAASEI